MESVFPARTDANEKLERIDHPPSLSLCSSFPVNVADSPVLPCHRCRWRCNLAT